MAGKAFSMNEAAAPQRKFDIDDDFSTFRPGTARPKSTGKQRYLIMVISENRNREVGIASVDVAALHTINLMQLSDSQSYAHVLSYLEMSRPTEIIFSKTQQQRLLMQKIIEQFGGAGSQFQCQVSSITRKAFDEVKGEAYLKALACDAQALQPGGRAEMAGRYLALASLSALVQYVEYVQHVNLAAGGLRIAWSGGEGRMALDFETVRNLELLANARTGDTRSSLFGVIDSTKTAVGSKLLQANLLAPVADDATLNARLDAVDALLGGDDAYVQIGQCLSKLPELDVLLSSFAYTPKVCTPRTARVSIGAIIALKHVLEVLPNIAFALESGPAQHSALLDAIAGVLKEPMLEALRTRIGAIITDDTSWSRSAAAARQQEVFAVKPEIDGSLDAVRTIYTDCVQEIMEEAEKLRLAWELPGLKLNYTAARGYHLQLPPAASAAPPAGIIQAVKTRGGGIACTTDSLAALNDRLRENLFACYVMTNAIVTSLLEHVRHAMGTLSRAVECVALLDMLQSFAANVLSAPSPDAYCRPTFASGGEASTVIEGGRHPIVERLSKAPFVPNDLVLTPEASTLVMTGPNCSGKSTFLRQTALLHVLAHCGSYIPARSAHFRVTNRICTRLGTGDDLEANASSFLKEMKEAAFALAHAGDSALVLIDELGRGTSNEDGVGVAWAVVEALASRTGAFSLVTTHYHELTGIANLLPNVKNVSMQVDVDSGGNRPDTAAVGAPGTAASGAWSSAGAGAGSSSSAVAGSAFAPTPLASVPQLRFRFSVTDGASSHKSDYGLALAEMCGLPRDVLKDARRIKASLAERLATAGRPGTSILSGLAWPGTGRPSTGVPTGSALGTAGAASSSDNVIPSPPSTASSITAARDKLLARLMDSLAPVLAAVQEGQLEADDPRVLQAIAAIQAQFGPELSAAGIDHTRVPEDMWAQATSEGAGSADDGQGAGSSGRDDDEDDGDRQGYQGQPGSARDHGSMAGSLGQSAQGTAPPSFATARPRSALVRPGAVKAQGGSAKKVRMQEHVMDDDDRDDDEEDGAGAGAGAGASGSAIGTGLGQHNLSRRFAGMGHQLDMDDADDEDQDMGGSSMGGYGASSAFASAAAAANTSGSGSGMRLGLRGGQAAAMAPVLPWARGPAASAGASSSLASASASAYGAHAPVPRMGVPPSTSALGQAVQAMEDGPSQQGMVRGGIDADEASAEVLDAATGMVVPMAALGPTQQLGGAITGEGDDHEGQTQDGQQEQGGQGSMQGSQETEPSPSPSAKQPSPTDGLAPFTPSCTPVDGRDPGTITPSSGAPAHDSSSASGAMTQGGQLIKVPVQALPMRGLGELDSVMDSQSPSTGTGHGVEGLVPGSAGPTATTAPVEAAAPTSVQPGPRSAWMDMLDDLI